MKTIVKVNKINDSVVLTSINGILKFFVSTSNNLLKIP